MGIHFSLCRREIKIIVKYLDYLRINYYSKLFAPSNHCSLPNKLVALLIRGYVYFSRIMLGSLSYLLWPTGF